MSGSAVIFVVISALGVLALPRRLAVVPLLVGACYMTLGQGISLGPFRFTVIRMLVMAGVIRVLMRNERPVGGLNGLDWSMIAWGACCIMISVFHNDPTSALVYRMGLVYNGCGIYFLIRILCQSTEDVIRLIKITGFLLVPIALEMTSESFSGQNRFAILGGVPAQVAFRDGSFRAQGPFGHAILAGTVGALCVPLLLGIWRTHPKAAKIGLAASLTMVLTSASSGPVMTTVFGIVALVLWRWRHLMGRLRIALVITLCILQMVMKAPVYYLIARIDITGSSSSYHRAAIIEAALDHLHEWWFSGTDYTRHWMPYGVSWSEDHIDITNQYLQNGVNGGLPLMLLFIVGLWIAFRYVGQALRWISDAPFAEKFMIWALGAGMFAHTATGISVNYFDQSIVFLYLNQAAIASLHASTRLTQTACYSIPGDEPGPADAEGNAT